MYNIEEDNNRLSVTICQGHYIPFFSSSHEGLQGLLYPRSKYQQPKGSLPGRLVLVDGGKKGDRRSRRSKTIPAGFEYPLMLVCHKHGQDIVIMCNICNNIFQSSFQAYKHISYYSPVLHRNKKEGMHRLPHTIQFNHILAHQVQYRTVQFTRFFIKM